MCQEYIPEEQINRFKVRPPARRLPKSVIRQIMLKSSDGGRGRCTACGLKFSMKYIIHGYRPGEFGEEKFFCRDCAKELNVVRSDK